MNKVDQLATEYLELMEVEQELKEQKSELAERIKEEAQLGEKRSKTMKGEQYKLNIRRNFNTSYDKEMLEELLAGHEETLLPLFRMEFKERTSSVEKFLVEGGELAEKIASIREVKEGSSSIKLEKM